MDTNDKAISVIYDLHREIKILDETVGSLEGMKSRAFKDLEIEKEKNKELAKLADKERTERGKVDRMHKAIDALLNLNPLLSQLPCATYDEVLESGIQTLIAQLTVENGKLAAQKSELEDLIEKISNQTNFLDIQTILKVKEEEQGSD